MNYSPFVPIGPPDRDRLAPFFENQSHPLCVYSLPSLLVWSSKIYQPYAAVVDDEALVVGVEFTPFYEDHRHLILPVSPSRTFTPEELARMAVDLGFSCYWFIPESYLETFGRDRVRDRFAISEQTHLTDYVYRTSDLAELKGNKYMKKRNLVNQFKRSHVMRGRSEAAPITGAAVPECLDFLEQWCEERDCDASPEMDLACEKQAVINSLTHLEILEMKGLLMRVDGAVSAIGIASGLTPEMGALHFEKAFSSIKGLYQYFDRLCARRLFNGYRYINKESDMDLERLARAKASYHPVRMVPSYRLTLR